MALGLHEAGFEHRALVELEAKACDTLKHNAELWAARNGSVPPWTPDAVRLQDVREFDPTEVLHACPELDLLAGGPPCQPFSLGGVHAGMSDGRNMFPAALELVRELRPRLVLFENVPGLLRQSFLPYFDYVEFQLRDLACAPKKTETWQEHRERLLARTPRRKSATYRVTRQVINAADFGVPQVRKRVFLMAVRADLAEGSIAEVEATHSEEALLRALWSTGSYWEAHGLPTPMGVPERLQPRVRRAIKTDDGERRPWRTVRDAIADLPEPQAGRESDSVPNHIGIPGARSYPGHTGSDIDWPSKTIKAGVHGVCGGEAMIRYPDDSLRYMTVRESARIQTFPDQFVFLGARSNAMRHIGNAVPVHVARAVGAHMLRHLTA